MKKIIGLLLVLAFCVQGFSVLALQNEKDTIQMQETISLGIPQIIEREDTYVFVDHELATSYTMEPGNPLLPRITKVYQIPLNAELSSVDVIYSSVHSLSIPSQVKPSPKPVIDGSFEDPFVKPNDVVYGQPDAYPGTTYTVREVAGLDGQTHVRYVAVTCFPVQYYPSENMITYAEDMMISLNYIDPKETVTYPDEYDLMVIAPEEFGSSLQSFIDHKNENGVSTYLETLETIYTTFTEGRNPREQIKYAIKDAIETKGITYVLLVGGHVGQTHEWYTPVQYGQSLSEEAYLSDLYYADVYRVENNQTVFEDWDSDGDGNIAEFKMFEKDIIDGAPDVYVGRLAVRSLDELNTVLSKIIQYEAKKADESWFKKMLLIGGDTYPESSGGVCEAEIDTNLSASFMTGFTFERLWASLGTLTGQPDVEDAFNEGAGFVHMAGHANPASLVTFPPGDAKKEQKIIIMAMYNFYSFPNVNPSLTNKDMLPVVIVGGCHNSQFNVTLANIVDGIKEYGIMGYFFSTPYKFFYMEWVPKCWSWWLVSNPDGGSIATLGNTGLGMGIQDEGYVTGLDGWLFPRFFYHYGQMGEQNIGMAQGSAITDYVLEFDINADGNDRQMVQQWALLGDPSLLPGGYS
jgi:hypothetical protein